MLSESCLTSKFSTLEFMQLQLWCPIKCNVSQLNEHQLQEQITYSVEIIMFNTNTYNFIFARASLNLTIASSCLTVIGIAADSPVSFACCLMSYRKYHNNEVNLDTGPTQWSSFWKRNSATEQSNGYSQVTSCIKYFF